MLGAPKPGPIALLGGKGDLPFQLAQVFQKQIRPFVILAFKNQTDEKLIKDLPHIWLHLGEVGKALKYLKDNQIQEVVMAGTISRPGMNEIKPDWEGIKWLAKIGSKALGDDNLLKSIIKMIEGKGYKVVGPDDILTNILVTKGVLSSIEPDEQAWRDIARGIEVLSALSSADVGQAVVVQEGLVLGVEAIEGTDALIERAGLLHRPGKGGILIKIAKHHQEHRVDLPTIGLETIHKSIKAGLRGIAIEAGKSFFLNQEESLKLAQENSFFIVSLDSSQCHKSL